MSYDLNDAQPQMAPIGELIPDGTFAKVRLTVRPGGVDGATPMDAKLLKASQSSDAKMLDCEFTILEGPHARRKFWQSFTVAGGKVDENGQSIGWKISKSTFRAMVDSALGLDPRDESPDAKAKRVLPGLKHLDGIVFAARIMVDGATGKIGRVAVLADRRGTGVGAALMRAALQVLARQPGITTARLGAQTHALGFYERLGFVAEGPEYDDAGIPHRDMSRAL